MWAGQYDYGAAMRVLSDEDVRRHTICVRFGMTKELGQVTYEPEDGRKRSFSPI